MTDEPSLQELRCTVWSHGATLRLDAELVDHPAGGRPSSAMLAAGATAWSAADNGEFDGPARRWFTGTPDHGWNADPRLLPQEGAALPWGMHLAACLQRALGRDVLDELLVRQAAAPAMHVRLVFRALDCQAAALPFETLVWRPDIGASPLVADDARSVSVLRVADRVGGAMLTARRLGAREPGMYRRLVLAAAGGRIDHTFQGELTRAASPLGHSLSITEPCAFAASDRAVWESARQSDLLVLCGHGAAARGLDLGDGDRRDPAELADDLGGTGAVVLAMCGSGMSGSAGASPALAFARSGAALAVGFQGDKAAMQHVVPFLRRLAASLGPRLERERAGSRLSLSAWETALASARGRDWAATAPVVYVHPSALAGRAGASPRARPVRRLGPGRTRTVHAIPWYVPGQVACIREDGDDLRLPLPVDVGSRLRVDARSRDGASQLFAGTALTQEELVDVRTRLGVPSAYDITVTLERSTWASTNQHSHATWARRSAELGALVRALCALLGVGVPRDVVQLMHEAVATDWGALGAAPRLIDVCTGAAVRRLGTWPSLEVGAVAVRPPGPGGDLVAPELRDAPPLLADTGDEVAGALGSAVATLALMDRQLELVRDAGDTPPRLVGAIDAGGARVAIPSAAAVWSSARTLDAPAVTGAVLAAASTPDELDYEPSSS